MVLIKEFPKTCDVDELLNVAHKYTFSKSLVDQYEQEYISKPNPEILSICKLL